MKFFDKKWKWAVAAILLLIVGLLSYFLYTYFFYTCCTPPSKLAPAASKGLSSNPILNDSELLYAKRTTIGLCRTKSGDSGTCYSKTSLYFSGKLVTEESEVVMEPNGEKRVTHPATEKMLDKNSMDRIIKQIRDSKVLTKPCEAESVMDIYIDYFINLDGVKKQVKFPGCESEFNAINKLIDAASGK